MPLGPATVVYRMKAACERIRATNGCDVLRLSDNTLHRGVVREVTDLILRLALEDVINPGDGNPWMIDELAPDDNLKVGDFVIFPIGGSNHLDRYRVIEDRTFTHSNVTWKRRVTVAFAPGAS